MIKLAACWRRNVDEIETFDPSLRRAIDAGARGTRLTALDLAVAARAAWNARREAERSAETDA